MTYVYITTRERERKRETQTDTQTDTERDRERDRERALPVINISEEWRIIHLTLILVAEGY